MTLTDQRSTSPAPPLPGNETSGEMSECDVIGKGEGCWRDGLKMHVLTSKVPRVKSFLSSI